MPRLIDADALMQMPWVLPNRMTRETALECFRNIVSEAPTIDAEPVRHGWWDKHTLWLGGWGEKQMVCSECKKRYQFHADYNYCPHCGAKMDGGARDVE